MATTATLDGIVYITKADYDNLKANRTATISGSPQTYDANKIYIIKEELATEVTAVTASGSLSNQPATTNAIWAAILSASGATYSIHSTTFTNGAGISISSPKLGIASSTVGILAGNNVTITPDTTHNTITFSSTYCNSTYSLETGTGNTVKLIENGTTSWTRTIDNVTNASYATYIGNSTSNYTYSQLVTISSRADAAIASASTANASAQSAYAAAITNVLNSISAANSASTNLATTSAIYNFVVDKIAAVYEYQGTVTNYSDISSKKAGDAVTRSDGTTFVASKGDVLNIANAFVAGDKNYAAGTNVVCTGNTTGDLWDILAGDYTLTQEGSGSATISLHLAGGTTTFTVSNVNHANDTAHVSTLTAAQVVQALTITYLV